MYKAIHTILFGALTVLASCGVSQHQQGSNTNREINIEEAASQLQHKRWVLTKLADTSFPKPKKDIYIQFENNNIDLNGFGGCNGFSGIYNISAKGIVISRLISTQMWCDNGAIEQKLLAALQITNNFQVTDDVLQLVHDNKPVAYFNAVYLNGE